MSELSQHRVTLCDLHAALRDLERRLHTPQPWPESPSWAVVLRDVGELSGSRVYELLEDPAEPRLDAARRAAWGVEQRLGEMFDVERSS